MVGSIPGGLPSVIDGAVSLMGGNLCPSTAAGPGLLDKSGWDNGAVEPWPP